MSESDAARAALMEFAERKRLFWLNPVRGTCPECGAKGEILQEDSFEGDGPAVCAGCARRRAVERRDEFTYPCDECGEGPSFRDPLGREDVYLCARHQVELRAYSPTERTRLYKTAARISKPLREGSAQCEARNKGTECRGEVRWDSKFRMSLCNKHRGRTSSGPEWHQ